jgi:hypothetical protein
LKKPSQLSHKEAEERQGRPLPYAERPVLTQLLTATDVDDAAQEDAAESSGDNPAPDDAATAADCSSAIDENEVNAEAPATRLVNNDRSSRRSYAHLFPLHYIDIFISFHYKVLHLFEWDTKKSTTLENTYYQARRSSVHLIFKACWCKSWSFMTTSSTKRWLQHQGRGDQPQHRLQCDFMIQFPAIPAA